MTINERIKELRKNGLSMSMEKFGALLGISKSGVSEIESGRRNVTDQHIKMLSITPIDNKRISERWIRTGEGEMFVKMDIDDEIAQLIASLRNEGDDSFKKRLLAVLANLTEEQWELLADLAEKLTNK